MNKFKLLIPIIIGISISTLIIYQMAKEDCSTSMSPEFCSGFQTIAIAFSIPMGIGITLTMLNIYYNYLKEQDESKALQSFTGVRGE